MAENIADNKQQAEDLHQQLSMPKDYNVSDFLTDLDENKKRWMVTGIVLQSVLAPVLRKYVTIIMEQLYQTLKLNNNIDTQLYPNHLKRYHTTSLNYEAINWNKALGRGQHSRFNYQVKDAVDLSKLFLNTNMAHYDAFDDSCYLFQLIFIVIGCGPAHCQASAEKVRVEVANTWAHCDFSVWNDSKYESCLMLINKLIQSLGLDNQREIINQVQKLNYPTKQTNKQKWNQNVSECLTDLDKNERRWLVTGIVLHSVLAPVLRKYVTIIMEQLYQTLKLNSYIDTQLYPNHLKRYHTTSLNYEAINWNKALGRGQHSQFNYQVKDAVDLSKLFLNTNMAHYNAFDDNCKLSQLIAIVIGCGPAQCQASARKVKHEVRNPWVHCDMTAWDVNKFKTCMVLIKAFIESLDLEDNGETLAVLKKWNQNGEKFINATPFNVPEEIQASEELSAITEKTDQTPFPSAVYKMDDKSKALYAQALESGSEIKREIRVIIVGKKGAGKTSLTRRLLSKSIDDVTSTNGIDIHSITCEGLRGTWYEKKPTTADSRLLVGTIQMEKKLQEKLKEVGEKKEFNIDKSEAEVTHPPIDNDDKNKSSTTPHSPIDDTNYDVDFEDFVIEEKDLDIDIAKTSTSRRIDDIDDTNTDLVDMTKADVINENETRISIWDFGGDEEFYYTHQVFLAQEVVFLILTNLADSSDSCGSDGEFKFWLDTIHSLCENRDDTKLEPRCIVVGTHKDKCNTSDAVANIENKKRTVGKLWGHVHGEVHFVSNTELAEEDIEKIKMSIIDAAKMGKSWETNHPLKFALLDKALEKKREGDLQKPIISYEDIKAINEDLKKPLSQQELDLYLRYNHMAGHLIYYEDLPNNIVLDAQWLSNVFRCIVTADEFQDDFPKLELEKMRNTGEVSDIFLKELFRIKKIEEKYQRYLLQVLEKFHILVWRESGDKMSMIEGSYYAPCMVRSRKLKSVNEHFIYPYTSKSNCLCINFDFLSPFLFYYIVMLLCGTFRSSETKEGYPAFCSNAAIYDISSFEKLVLDKCKNVLQMQVFSYGNRKLGSYNTTRELLERTIKQVTRDFSIQINFDVMIKCPETSYDYCDNLLEFMEDDNGYKYTCKEHMNCQLFENYWVERNKLPLDRESVQTDPNEIKIQVLYEPKIMAAFGSSLRVSARIECNPKLTGIKVSWQKVVNKEPVTLDINSKKYQGSTNEIPTAVLVIRGVSNADAGEYQIEVVSTTGTVVSQQVIIEVFKDSLDVSPLMVNGYAVDCIVGELHNHYQITKSSDTVEALVDVHDCQLEDYCSKLWNELGILNMLVTWTLSDNKQPEYWLDKLSSWMATNYSDTVSEVPCRLILSRLKCIMDQSSVVKLMEIYQKAISTHKTKTAKAIAWHLVRSFLQSQPDLKFQDMWPGIECDSNEFVIVVEVKDGQETSSQCDFYGTNVKFHTSNGFSLEARNIVQKLSSIDMSHINVLEMKGVCAEEAEHLFSRHRNLTLISKSPLKSNRCNGKKEEFELIITPCIQLYCRVKGVVPVGEPQFPKFINNIRTDVIEGYSEFGCKTLKIGNEVGWCNSGTLGGFLKYRGKNAFLTCAHVLFEREHLALDADISFINEHEISISCNKENYGLMPCGTYADHRFPPYRNTDDGVSIDAAIVRLFDDWCPEDCKYLHNSALECRGIGTKENITVCAYGAVSGTKEYNVNIAIPKNPSVIEFEQLHQLLERTWHTVAQAGISANEHARITFIEAGETDKKIPRRVELYNQIAFHQIGFKQGDSGMCIYGKDETGIKGCYGMAIATHASGGCIVTPMTSILTALNIPQPKKANQ